MGVKYQRFQEEGTMYHKVLVPYDMSEPAQNALVAALDLVQDVPDAVVTVLNVVDWQED